MNEKNIGNIISKLRDKAKLTQKDLAEKLNIGDKAVSKWETGVNLPSIDMIYKLSVIFHVSFQDLLKVRLEDEHVDEKVIKNIMNEFDETNRRKTKRIKIILLITLGIILALVLTLIFTRTYNKFVVYRASVDSEEIYADGIYVETRIKDTFVLNNVRLRSADINKTDIVSADIYYLNEKNKEILLYTSENLQVINFSNCQTLVATDDLTKYIDNLYLRIIITNSKNKITEYTGKLKFEKDFSNNKIYKDENYKVAIKNIVLNKDKIKEKLLANGFEENTTDNLVKNTEDYKMIYYYDSNKLFYCYEENSFMYKYTYSLDLMTLEVVVYDEHNTEIENYEYDVDKEEVIACKIGRCSSYDVAMKMLKRNVLDYLYET